jgi:hypothetical protein
MNDAAFEKVSSTDKPLYGPRKLLLCGFSQSVQPKFNTLLELLGLSAIPRVWVTEAQADILISKLLEFEDDGVGSIIGASKSHHHGRDHPKGASSAHDRLPTIKDEADAMGHTDPHVGKLDDSKLAD